MATSLLEEHLKCRANNLNELLSYSRQAIVDCTEHSEDAQEQAERTLGTIRLFLFDYERDNPEHSAEIQLWWKEVFQTLIPNEAQYRQIDRAKEAQTRLARYEARFQQAWGFPSRELLRSEYTPASGFNKKTLQALVQFAEQSSCEDGQAALQEALRLRLQSNDKRPYRTRQPYLVPSDVKKAEEVYKSDHGAVENDGVAAPQKRKRKRRAEEDRTFSVQGQRQPKDLDEVPPDNGDDTDPSIEIGRGAHPSLGSTKQRESLDDSFLIPEDTDGSLMLASPAAPSLPQLLDSSSPPRLFTPNPEGEEDMSRLLPQNSNGKENMSHLLQQCEEQSSPATVTRPHMASIQSCFPTSHERQVGSSTARQDAIPCSHLTNHTEPHSTRIDRISYTPTSMDAAESSSTQAPSAPRTTQRNELPTTDLAGALSTLEPGQYLSASAVELVLTTCCPEDARVIDSACFNLDSNNPTSPNLRLCGAHVAKVFLPIHHRNHWTLAIFDRQARIITHYNSLSTKSTFKDALDRTLPMFMSTVAGDKTCLTITYEELCTQTNSYDCGVHMLMTALCVFVNSSPSKFADTKLWRLIFRALLTETLQTESCLGSSIDALGDAGDGTLRTNLEEYKVKLTASRLSVAHAEEALYLFNQILNRIVALTQSLSQLPVISEPALSSLFELRRYSHVFESLNLDQIRASLQAGLIKGNRLRKESLVAEKRVRAAMESVQRAKDMRTEDDRRLSLQMQKLADATRKKGEEQLAAAEAEIEASKQLCQLLCM